MIKVLFVCLGNICRSPMAEAVLRDKISEEGLADKIEVDSAGTSGWHIGKPPHEGTRKKLDQKDVSYQGMKGRQVEKADFHTFDYIIAMDDQNMKDLQLTEEDKGKNTVAKLTDFVISDDEINVPDPYFTGDFDYTYELVNEGTANILANIKEKHNI